MPIIKCPVCGSRTTLRTSKKDNSKFHLCDNYPNCKGKVSFNEDYSDDGEEKRSRAMRIAGSLIPLICGIVLLAGVFLPWIHSSIFAGREPVSFSISGWDIVQGKTPMGIGQLVKDWLISSNIHALIVFVGAILMVLSTLPVFVLVLKNKSGVAVKTCNIIISVAAVVSVGGLMWFLIDMSIIEPRFTEMSIHWTRYIGYGVYVCGAGAVLGLIFGALASIYHYKLHYLH